MNSKFGNEIKELTNSNSKIVYNELPKDDPKRRKPEILLAKNRLGWSPKYKLETGLINTINYFKDLN